MTKFTKSKEWLVDEYVIKNRSRKEIADECGLTEAGLKSLLKSLDIKKEKLDLKKENIEILINQDLDHSEIEKQLNISQTTLYRYLRKFNLEIHSKTISKYDDSNDELIVQLYNDGFSTIEIAKEFNTTHRTIITHLQHQGVPRRTLTEAQWTHNNKSIPEEFNSKEVMENLYINKKLSKVDLASKFNCDPCVIDKVLKSFNIPIRNNSESKFGLFTGEKHWNWKGGVTSLARRLREYFSVRQSLKILRRDKYKCQMCGSSDNLNVHHKKQFSEILFRILSEHPNLDPIKDIEALYEIAINDTEFNDLNNLITYCQDCHFYKVHKYKNLQADFKSGELLEDCSTSCETNCIVNQQPS